MFLFGIPRKKKLFQFYRLLKSVFLFDITRKKNLFQFYKLLKSVFLFGITRKKKFLFQFYRLLKYVFLFGITRKKNFVTVFFFVCIISITGYTNFLFLFLETDNNKTAVFLVSVVFKLFEDCNFSVSIVLKYLFLYSNIFRFYTAVLHSKYLLHIYIQIFVTEMASPSTPVNSIPNHGEKPERFNGTDFKKLQQKMLFYLTTLNLARFLNEDGSKLDVGETDKEKLVDVDAWNHSDFLCRNYVLNGLENTLYNVYSPLKTAKEFWDSLDKYKTEDAGLKKFIVDKFLDFKMVDSKTVLSQVQELQVVVHDIHAEGMTLSETFQVVAFIEKLPPS